MKKKFSLKTFLMLILSIAMICAFTSCGNDGSTESGSKEGSVKTEETDKKGEGNAAYFGDTVKGDTLKSSVLFAYANKVGNGTTTDVDVTVVCNIANATDDKIKFNPELFELDNNGVISTPHSNFENKLLSPNASKFATADLHFTFSNEDNTDVTDMVFTADGQEIKLEIKPQAVGSNEASEIIGKYVSENKLEEILIYNNDDPEEPYYGIYYMLNEDGTLNEESYAFGENYYRCDGISLNEENKFWVLTRKEYEERSGMSFGGPEGVDLSKFDAEWFEYKAANNLITRTTNYDPNTQSRKTFFYKELVEPDKE